MDNHVLIIGGPNAGKTHFGGQLYGRLNSRQFNNKIAPQNRPSDLTIFQDVLDKLSEGKRAGHTEASANRNIELKIDNDKGDNIVFAFPDYAGEQVKMIVDSRRINTIWKDYIDKSTSWILFIRLDEISPIEDIINKGIPSAEEIKRRDAQPPPVLISDTAFFVELLQMILHIKGIPSLSKVNKPNLTVILSCWDVLNLTNDVVPFDLLKERLPMLVNFIKNTWKKDSISVVGLSSTEKTLTDEPDEEYIDKTPINFGYIINTKGEKETDLTISIKEFIGRS